MTEPATAYPSQELPSSEDEAAPGRLPTLADRIIGALARQSLPRALSYTVTAVVVLASAAVQKLLPLYHVPYLLLIPTIFVISLTFGLGEGLMATVMSAFIANYLFMGSIPHLRISRPEVVTSVLFLFFSAFIALVCDTVRRSALRQSVELERNRMLKQAAEASAHALGESQEELRALNETLELKVVERTAALEEAQEALRQSQKMEAVGQLTGGVAHDFNNLLAGIVGGLELARARLDQGRPQDAPRYLEIAQDAARRGAALTRRLLAFSRRQSIELEQVDIGPLVAGMEDLIRRTVGPAVSVTVDMGEGPWLAWADQSQVENALLNLAINSRDAMSGRGELVIAAEGVTVSEAEAESRAMIPGDYVRLSVRDTGCGMTPEVAARCFDPFFTTKPVGAGTGLGLSMIYAFARQAGGAIWLETAPDEGTTLSLLLPRRSENAQAHGQEVLPPLSERTGEGRTVLVIDDEASVRTVFCEALEAGGYVALAAAHGPAALALVRSEMPIDLLVCDLGLPGDLNGRQVYDMAARLRPGLKALFVTGYPADEVDALLDPDMVRLAKPCDLDTLRRMVSHVLAD
jgi:signal transduction histidine kinase